MTLFFFNLLGDYCNPQHRVTSIATAFGPPPPPKFQMEITTMCSLCTEALRSDHRRRKRLHGSGCTTAKAVLEELVSTMKCTYPTLQDGNALLCHSCELRLTNIRKAETKISDMKGIVRDQLATLCKRKYQ